MKYLLFDVPNLCHISFYALPSMLVKGAYTNVIVGLFRDIVKYTKLYSTERVVFCFDEGESLRKKIYPNYKVDRKSQEVLVSPGKEIKHYHSQVGLLKDLYLPKIGFKNLPSQEGYEADDIVGSLVVEHPDKDFIIVSTDRDYYQLLGDRVRIYNPRNKKEYTQEDFIKDYKIPPKDFPLLKAMAGCRSDCIEGIRGVGEVFASRYIRGDLPAHTKAYQGIVANRFIWERNLKIVKLPLGGTPSFKLLEDKINKDPWQEILQELEIRSVIIG